MKGPLCQDKAKVSPFWFRNLDGIKDMIGQDEM